MNQLYVPGVDAAAPIPGVQIHETEPGLEPGDFRDFVSELWLPDHFGQDGSLVQSRPAEILGEVIVAKRTPENPRDPWAPDHHWHSDRMYWGEDQFASVLYARSLDGVVAPTDLLDTEGLLDAIERDHPGLTDELLPSEAHFSVRRYFEEILPRVGSTEAIDRTLAQHQAANLSEVADMQEATYPPKSAPAIRVHPFSGELCIYVDEVRIISFTNTDPERSRALIDMIRSEYLDLPPTEMADRPYFYQHQWEPGQVVIFPQIGTLHRAEASPEGELGRHTLRQFIA